METLQTLSTALGIGFLTGIRLYATALAIGIVLRMHLFTVPANLSHLSVLAEPWVMIAAGVGCTMEFLADKVPWVDSLWDSFHTIIRPVGAALIGTQILGGEDPATRTALALLCGGVALAGHSSKAATRLVVNHSPEPFSNIALSVAEDLMVPFGLWVTLEHPLVASVFVGCFLALFCWLAPKVFRIMHVEWLAFRGVLGRNFGTDATPVSVPESGLAIALQSRLQQVPSKYAAALRTQTGDDPIYGFYCAAARNVPGLKNSVGYLCFLNGDVVFVAKRLFRYRVFKLPAYSAAKIGNGLLFDTIAFDTDGGRVEFDGFKIRKRRHAAGRPALSHT